MLFRSQVALAEQQSKQSLANLIGTTWQWANELRISSEIAPIENPEKYTLIFAEDGSLNIQADCNQAAGTYELGASGAITITMGPATLAACPGDSRGEEFVQLLGSATSYQFEQGQLVLLLNSQSGLLGMIFEKME